MSQLRRPSFAVAGALAALAVQACSTAATVQLPVVAGPNLHAEGVTYVALLPEVYWDKHKEAAKHRNEGLEMAAGIVAAVHGNAVGIGTTMLFHCDFVLAEDGCRFLMPFVDLGLVPEAASSLIFPRLAGRRRAARHLLLGEPFGAAEALDMGLASHVVPNGQLGAALSGLVAALLAKPPEALRQTQALLRREDTEAVLERMELENGHFAERLQSDEVKSAITAFFAARARA